jgi:cytochrome c553
MTYNLAESSPDELLRHCAQHRIHHMEIPEPALPYLSSLRPMLRPLLYAGAALFLCAAEADAAPPRDTIAARVAPCMTCHGKEGRATSDGYYPRIAGKPAGYLYNQLRNFRDGRRHQYPLMTYMVSQLSDAYLQEIAHYFSEQHLPYPPPQHVDVPQTVLERGRVLVHEGDASKKVPACVACHGNALTGIAPSIPGLLGLPRDYLNAQFGAWRDGVRHAAAPDCMAQVAQRLSTDDISAASAWLATQAVPADAAPAPSTDVKLPLACGSLPQ